jgi:hypothetical protein
LLPPPLLLLPLFCHQDMCRFDEDLARQYIAEVVLALEYVHSKVSRGVLTSLFLRCL